MPSPLWPSCRPTPGGGGWAPLVSPPVPRCNKLLASATEQDAARVRSAATVPPEVLKIGSSC
ncbi:leucine-rich repeat-containing protein 30 [Platysternon megacephalum]|uniref:Leucine-rich repeat-containing protein 30 n=1 Tax=Platysternon megacephalum TaxID=55544 RepID=A0A4D9EPA1_9SAUR|nr:leucine-rich repeat-containing protein 30 [Platysternon megacephalum]